MWVALPLYAADGLAGGAGPRAGKCKSMKR